MNWKKQILESLIYKLTAGLIVQSTLSLLTGLFLSDIILIIDLIVILCQLEKKQSISPKQFVRQGTTNKLVT